MLPLPAGAGRGEGERRLTHRKTQGRSSNGKWQIAIPRPSPAGVGLPALLPVLERRVIRAAAGEDEGEEVEDLLLVEGVEERGGHERERGDAAGFDRALRNFLDLVRRRAGLDGDGRGVFREHEAAQGIFIAEFEGHEIGRAHV